MENKNKINLRTIFADFFFLLLILTVCWCLVNFQLHQGPGKVAFRVGGTINETGNIWISDADGSHQYKLTNSNRIDKIISWSPNNRYILVSILNKKDKYNTTTEYVVVDANSGDETIIPIDRFVDNNLIWTGNKEIVYLHENVIYKLTFENQKIQKKEIQKIPREIEKSFISLNRVINAFVYETSKQVGGWIVNDIRTYDLQKNQIKLIASAPQVEFIGWKKNELLYLQNKILWSSTIYGKIKTKLLDMGEWHNLSGDVSRDGNKFFYSAYGSSNRKMFIFNKISRKNKELHNLTGDNYATDLSISRDGNYGAYSISGFVNNSSQTIDFSNSKISKLCASSCYYPVWQN